MAVAAIEHIDVDENGVARIVGRRVKVIHIVMDKMANGWSPDEIHRQYPGLSLAAIHAAFAYYYDHQDELDAEIERDIEQADALRKQAGESPLAARLRLRDESS